MHLCFCMSILYSNLRNNIVNIINNVRHVGFPMCLPQNSSELIWQKRCCIDITIKLIISHKYSSWNHWLTDDNMNSFQLFFFNNNIAITMNDPEIDYTNKVETYRITLYCIFVFNELNIILNNT